MAMDAFDSLPVHAQNALRRAGITSAEQARAVGRDGLANIPGLGPLAIARLFTANEPQQRAHTLTSDELRRAKRWFDALHDTAPMRLGDGDRALARKISGWVD
jgi:hypothetical protein